MVFCVLKSFPLLRSQFIYMIIYFSDTSVFCDQLAGTDFTDSLDSGHIVRTVANDCKDFDNLLRSADAVFPTDLLNVHQFVLASGFSWLVLDDGWRYELTIVFVRGYHICCKPIFLSTFCH